MGHEGQQIKDAAIGVALGFQDAVELVIDGLTAWHKGLTDRPPVYYVHGAPGIGKSALAVAIQMRLAQLFNSAFSLIDFRGALKESADLGGYPHIEIVNGVAVTRFVAIEDLPFEGNPNVPEYGVLFLDELNRSQIDTQNAMFQLVYDRKVGTHKLKKGWIMLCAGNLGSADKCNVKETDAALNNRFGHITLIPNIKDFVKHMGPDSLVAQFVQDKENYFNVPPNGPCYPTPRSWDHLQKVIDGFGGITAENKRKIANQAISFVGPMAGIAFNAWLDTRSTLTIEEIIENFDDPKVQKELKNLSWGAVSEKASSFTEYLKKQPPEFYKIDKNCSDEERKAKQKRGRNIRKFLYDFIMANGHREHGVGAIVSDILDMTPPRPEINAVFQADADKYIKASATMPKDRQSPIK